MAQYLSYHPKTGLQIIAELPLPAAKVGTYIGERNIWRNGLTWKLRVKRRTKGSTWKQISLEILPKEIKLDALIMGIKL